jgi:hypothetical protein
MATVSEGKQTVFKLSKKELPNTGTSFVYCEETLIQTKNDTTLWRLKKENVTVLNAYESIVWSMISSGGDSISIHDAKGFRKKIYKLSPAEGLVFMRRDEQIAAYQQSPRYLWIRKDLNKQDKQILGGAVVSLVRLSFGILIKANS